MVVPVVIGNEPVILPEGAHLRLSPRSGECGGLKCPPRAP
jgi:hypothetical protein